jgi:AAA family ATP:ADP antiporter
MRNPFRAFMDIRKNELTLSLLMFSYFFLVITSFWILKPLKKTLFIGFYQENGFELASIHLSASQAELIAKVMNMVIAFAAVAVFTMLARRFRRQQLTVIFSGFFMVCYVIFTFLINGAGDVTVWTFYLFGDLFSTLMVATFFAFMNDSVTPGAAKRLYGLIGLGGVMGGAFGSMVVRVWIDSVSISSWLWVTFATTLIIAILAVAAGRIVDRTALPEQELEIEVEKGEEKKDRGNAALEGAKLVFRSKYLLAIVGVVGFYEIASTVLDFQFTSTVAHYVSGEDMAGHFSTVYTITNFMAMFVQLFLTSFIMTRFSVKVALMILPGAIILASAGYLALPVLAIGSAMNTADNGFSYSINQSAKETLYVPTSRDEKYKAKAFIDMFVQRFAKVLAVGVSLLVTMLFRDYSSIRYLSLFVVLASAAWLMTVRYAGKRFEELSAGRE